MPLPTNLTISVDSFKPTFTDDELQALKREIRHARSTLPVETYASRQTKYGTTHEWISQALEYWENTFDWRRQEKHLHQVDNYKAQIQDKGTVFEMHFIAHFSSDPNAIPLLLNHGWPSSAFEFVEVVKILRESTSPAFHVIAANQPGYGWSSPPPLDRGFGMYDCADILHKLMLGLGFTRGYAVQGGDIGSVISRMMAVKFNECKAINVNYLPLLPPTSILANYLPASVNRLLPGAVASAVTALTSPLLGDPASHGLTERETANAKLAYDFATTGRAYGSLHGTKPGTAGLVIQSSPTALLAWLGEKYRDWTDDDLSLAQLLEIVTEYWILGSFPNTIYAYSELTGGVATWHRDPALYISKPMGFSSFAKEIASAPKLWASQTGNLQYYNYHEKGGHFAALERPQEFASDMQACFSRIWPGFS